MSGNISEDPYTVVLVYRFNIVTVRWVLRLQRLTLCSFLLTYYFLTYLFSYLFKLF